MGVDRVSDSVSIRVAGDRDRAGAEQLIRATFSMDEARYRLMYERDPRCRPENLYVAVVEDEVIGVNGFREVDLAGLFSDGRPCERGIVSGGTAIRPDYRLRGISKAIFHEAWEALGSKYAFCLGFTRPDLFAGYLRSIGFAGAAPAPAIAYEKRFVRHGMAARAWNTARSALIRLKFRGGATKPPSERESHGVNLRLTSVTTDESIPALDRLNRAEFVGGRVATAVRARTVWGTIVRERRVYLLETVRTPPTPLGYAIVRVLDEELFVEEVVAPDDDSLVWLAGQLEELSRSLGKRRLGIRGDSTHIALCSRRGGYSAFELRYLSLLRPFQGLVEQLTSPHGRVSVRDDFLGRTYRFGTGPEVLEVSLPDLTEYLWGAMSLSKLVKRVNAGAQGKLTNFLTELRRRNVMRPLGLPYLELY